MSRDIQCCKAGGHLLTGNRPQRIVREIGQSLKFRSFRRWEDPSVPPPQRFDTLEFAVLKAQPFHESVRTKVVGPLVHFDRLASV